MKWTVGTLRYTWPGLLMLFFWLLLGDFSWTMRERSVTPMSQWYLNNIQVPNLLFGLLISSLPALITLTFGPIISVKSDRHRGKYGRRIPYLLIVTPIGALAMIGMGLTPILASWMHELLTEKALGLWLHRQLDVFTWGEFMLGLIQNKMVVSVCLFAVCWSAFEFSAVAGQAIFGGLINDVVPRSLLGRFYGLFRAVSLIDGIIFNFWIMGWVPTHFTWIMVIVGVFYGVSFMFVCLKVKEGEYPPPPTEEEGGQGPLRKFWRETTRYCRECFSHKYYVCVFLLMSVATLAFAPVNIYAIPQAASLGIDMATFGKALAAIFFVSLCLSYFIGWLADLVHPLRMLVVIMVLYSLATLYGVVCEKTAHSFLVLWILHGVISGCYYTSTASLGQRLFPHSKYAQFASAAGILGAIGTMFVGPAVGLVVDWRGNNYVYTFATGCMLAVLATVLGLYVYKRFLKLGGHQNYRPPEV
ncbi:MAG: MFS transporter [Verrucomicrobiota bacterium JB024]|nr:MFS transporter [Verrucomicrobiota bacterium JB024]